MSTPNYIHTYFFEEIKKFLNPIDLIQKYIESEEDFFKIAQNLLELTISINKNISKKLNDKVFAELKSKYTCFQEIPNFPYNEKMCISLFKIIYNRCLQKDCPFMDFSDEDAKECHHSNSKLVIICTNSDYWEIDFSEKELTLNFKCHDYEQDMKLIYIPRTNKFYFDPIDDNDYDGNLFSSSGSYSIICIIKV